MGGLLEHRKLGQKNHYQKLSLFSLKNYSEREFSFCLTVEEILSSPLKIFEGEGGGLCRPVFTGFRPTASGYDSSGWSAFVWRRWISQKRRLASVQHTSAYTAVFGWPLSDIVRFIQRRCRSFLDLFFVFSCLTSSLVFLFSLSIISSDLSRGGFGDYRYLLSESVF